jgi:hypothetical protein
MTTKRNHHDTLKRLDPDGRSVIGVFLRNALATVWLFEDDYNAIVAEYGLTAWFLNSNGKGQSYVRLKGKHGNFVQVSRLIVGASIKGNVSYRDGNHLNLRSTNLHVMGNPWKRALQNKSMVGGLHIPQAATNG